MLLVPASISTVQAQDSEIPAWIKNNAGWWADGQIDDNSFVSGIQYLIKVGIIVVEQEQTPTPEPTELDTSTTSDFSVKKYTDKTKFSKLPRFEFEYPDDWVVGVGHPDAAVAVDDKYDWRTNFQVFWENELKEEDYRDEAEVLQEM